MRYGDHGDCLSPEDPSWNDLCSARQRQGFIEERRGVRRRRQVPGTSRTDEDNPGQWGGGCVQQFYASTLPRGECALHFELLIHGERTRRRLGPRAWREKSC